GRETVVATGQRRQRLHLAEGPYEAEAGVAVVPDECGTAPGLVAWIRFVGLRDTRNDTQIVFQRPQHRAVGATERTEILFCPEPPDGGVCICIVRGFR